MNMPMNALLFLTALVAGLPAANAAEPARVTVAEKSPFGAYLADSEGRSLYLFEADEAGKSTCYDACANAWPPYTTSGEPWAGKGVDADALGTLERRDGTMQVTYDGWPLYYFIKDKAPGDTRGQDINGFGAEWYLVTPCGQKVHAE
ncbi:hypothetical protein [Marinobacter sp. Arc7-DN-1]|uniref:COG4315 family predicted lipoprotein n=1 Tax=Marinobacter sp. Arc7-DN-1 TaxID=2304594 RepID=UPI001967D79E|nr:hypothetical protein [Marinobacter sp. Arc7-DN-1]